MPFAAVHQLCAADARPARCAAGAAAAGVAVSRSGWPPATLRIGSSSVSRCSSLLTEVAAEQPLVCLVDDAQWLDEPSRQVLGFVGRRLLAEAVVLVFAVREVGDERLFPALPSLTIEGLTVEDARALLTAAVPGHLDERVRDRIVAETRGNPLALLELPREMRSGGAGRRVRDADQRTVRRACRTTTCGAYALCPSRPSNSCCWRPPTPPATPRSCGAPAQALGVGRTQRPSRSRNSCWRSACRCGSGIRSCGQPPTLAGTPEDRRAAHVALAAATDEHADPRASGVASGGRGDRTGRRRRRGARTDGRRGPSPRRGGGRGSVPRARRSSLTSEPRLRAERTLGAAASQHIRRCVRRGARPGGRGRGRRRRRSAAGPGGAAQGTDPVGVNPGP